MKNLIFSTFVGVLSQMMLTPAMQGVILAIAKARQTFDKEGPEAGLIKVCVCLFFLTESLWLYILKCIIIKVSIETFLLQKV